MESPVPSQPIEIHLEKLTSKEPKQFVEEWLKQNRESAVTVVENWLIQHPEYSSRVLEQFLPSSAHKTRRRSSSAANLGTLSVDIETQKFMKHFKKPSNMRKTKSKEFIGMDKQDIFMELLRDVISPNFDVNHLCHKILVNVMLLVNADTSSLFLADEEKQILVSRLFNVGESTTFDDSLQDESNAIKIPFGKGIAGYAAAEGEAVNIPDAYKDPRFNTEVDKITGYVTKSILCMPIMAPDGQAIGVAQVINKKGEEFFTKEDEEVFRMYMTFCAIGILNAQLLERSFSLTRRLKVLLDLAKALFKETTSLEAMITLVMNEAQNLIPCEHCTVVILDQEDGENVSFTQAFQMENDKNTITSLDISSVSDIDLVKEVATTGKPVKINNLDKLKERNSEVKNILCMPVFNKDLHTIGVVKLSNKLNSLLFESSDEEVFQVFATFCGLGIHCVLNYENIAKANARQKVALEMLSYHASASAEEAERIMGLSVLQTTFKGLDTFEFDDLILTDDQTIMASVKMFSDCGLTTTFKLDEKTLYRWVLTVRKNYRPVTYHNWRHALNVAQAMFTIFVRGRMNIFTDSEKLALLIACFCHDLDHRGTNNAFQTKTSSPLAELYSTSTMEHHHFDHCIMILNSQGNDILSRISTAQHDDVMMVLESSILATDLAVYFKNKGKLQELAKKPKKVNWKNEDHRDLLRGTLMTACDVSAITKPWEIQKRVAIMVSSEFFEQGDLERTNLHEEPAAMMDRKKKHELPKMQVGFIDFICLPLYKALAELFDGLLPLLKGVKDNRKNWQNLADHPESDPMFLPSDVPHATSQPLAGKNVQSGRKKKRCSIH